MGDAYTQSELASERFGYLSQDNKIYIGTLVYIYMITYSQQVPSTDLSILCCVWITYLLRALVYVTEYLQYVPSDIFSPGRIVAGVIRHYGCFGLDTSAFGKEV